MPVCGRDITGVKLVLAPLFNVHKLFTLSCPYQDVLRHSLDHIQTLSLLEKCVQHHTPFLCPQPTSATEVDVERRVGTRYTSSHVTAFSDQRIDEITASGGMHCTRIFSSWADTKYGAQAGPTDDTTSTKKTYDSCTLASANEG